MILKGIRILKTTGRFDTSSKDTGSASERIKRDQFSKASNQVGILQQRGDGTGQEKKGSEIAMETGSKIQG